MSLSTNRNEVKVYIKSDVYKDLKAISEALNKPMARLLRELIEQEYFIKTIKDMRAITDTLTASKLYDKDLFGNEQK